MGKVVVTLEHLIEAIHKNLTDDLLKSGYTGHCFIVTEAIYHRWGQSRGYKPFIVRIDGTIHW